MKNVRRSVLLLLLCFLILSAGSLFAQTGNTAKKKSVSLTYQITPTHTGSISTIGLKPPLKVKWNADLGATASYSLIVDDKVFVIANSNPSMIYALKVRNGETVWSQPSPSGWGNWIGIAYEKGKIFAVPSSVNGAGAMAAYDAKTGKQIWTTNLETQYSYSSPPTALNGIVYTGGAGSGGTVYAVSEKDGTVLWTGSVENGDDSSPVVTSTGVYVSYACPQTYRFDPQSGSQIWHFQGQCEGGGGATPVLYDGLLYVRDVYNYSTDGITLKASDGTYVGGFNSSFAPTFLGGTAFYTEDSSLTAVQLSSGKTLWSAGPPNGDSFSISPIVVNKVVYVGTAAGLLVGYDAASGKNVVSVSMGNPISGGGQYAGLSAGQGLLVVPAGNAVVAVH
jgi:outer membrane protein assembly factor BamB